MNDASNPKSKIVPVIFDQRREIEKNLPNPATVDNLLSSLPGYPPKSSRECYYLTRHKGILMIARNWKHRERWDLFLNDVLIEEGYDSADAAADCAYRHDFSSEDRDYPIKGLHIPADLQQWTKYKVWL